MCKFTLCTQIYMSYEDTNLFIPVQVFLLLIDCCYLCFHLLLMVINMQVIFAKNRSDIKVLNQLNAWPPVLLEYMSSLLALICELEERRLTLYFQGWPLRVWYRSITRMWMTRTLYSCDMCNKAAKFGSNWISIPGPTTWHQ